MSIRPKFGQARRGPALFLPVFVTVRDSVRGDVVGWGNLNKGDTPWNSLLNLPIMLVVLCTRALPVLVAVVAINPVK